MILSLWDQSGYRPTVEYARDSNGSDFGGEGTGKHVITTYPWKVGKWYTMKVKITYEAGKSVVRQYVREDKGKWKQMAAISYPVEHYVFSYCSFFQEDYGKTNRQRACYVRNARGKGAVTGKWHKWKTYVISNTYFPQGATWENGVRWNVNYNCSCGISKTGTAIWVRSGGHQTTEQTESKIFPYTCRLKWAK